MFATQLETIDYIETFPSQANYIMCRLSEGVIAKELANYLVKEKSILIKRLIRERRDNWESVYSPCSKRRSG